MNLDPTKFSAVDEPQPMIRVALVDDHAAVRAGLLAILGDEPRIDVVAMATTAGEAYQQIERQQPTSRSSTTTFPERTAFPSARA